MKKRSFLSFCFLVLFGAVILVAAARCALGQEAVQEQDTPKVDICSEKYINDADLYYENRLWRQTGRQAHTRYKEILEKCPDTPLRYETETKMLRVEEELAEHLFTIAMYYLELYIQTGGGGFGARALLKEIVDKMPHYSRITEVKMWLDEIDRLLPTEITP